MTGLSYDYLVRDHFSSFDPSAQSDFIGHGLQKQVDMATSGPLFADYNALLESG